MLISNERDLSWQGTNVNASSVERALSRMLQQAHSHDHDGQKSSAGRASVLTLIVRAENGDDEATAVETLSQLSERDPSRTLVLSVDPAAETPGLDAWATAHCRIRWGSSALVCFEQVRLSARGALADELPSVVSPLIIPDLPVLLWWMGDLPSASDKLLPLCDRLVVNSNSSGLSGLGRMSDLVKVMRARNGLADLSWSALVRWREALAHLFDPLSMRPFQRHIHSVRIEVAGDRLASQPFLLLAWMASSFGWSIEEMISTSAELGSRQVRLVGHNGPVKAHVVSVAPAGAIQAGEVALVSLDSALDGDQTRPASFTIHRDPEGCGAIVRVALPDQGEVSRTVKFLQPSMASLLASELERPAADRGYYTALAVLGRDFA